MRALLVQLLALLARPFAQRATGPIRRVLVIKPDHLGDLLLATPAVAALRRALPDARITGLVGPWSRRVWQGNPDLDALVELPFPGFERAKEQGARSKGTGLWSLVLGLLSYLRPYLLLLKYAVLLRRGCYDAALILRDDHWWGAALAALAGIPVRVGHAHPLCASLLTRALPYDPRRHVAAQALEVVAALAGTRGRGDAGAPRQQDVETPRWEVATEPSELPLTSSLPRASRSLFYPTPDEHAWAAEWLAAHLAPGERLVAIHPGTGGSAKQWLPERWAVVADALAAEPGVRLLLTGGPGEAELVAQVAGQMRRPSLNLAGQTSVGQLTALLARAVLVLGVDSGPLHLAVSQGAPTLHLFGPSDHARFGPWGDPARHLVLRAGLWCSPCGVFAACPRGTPGPECMDRIGADTVIAVARQLLG